MKALDPRIPIIANQAKVRAQHVFFTFHAMREMGPLFDAQLICGLTGLEAHHITAIIEGLKHAKALPKPKSERTAATRLTRAFVVPQEWIDWTVKERRWPETDARDEADTFVNYWSAEEDGAKLDWFATWKNWIKRSRRVVREQSSREWTPDKQREYLARLGTVSVGDAIKFEVRD